MNLPFSLLPLATGFAVDVDTSGTGVKVTTPQTIDPQLIQTAGGMAIAHMAVFLGAVMAIVLIVVWGRVKRSRLQHETIRLLAEKGLPIPPELFQPPVRRNDLRKGLVWMALGIGFTVLGSINPGHNQNVWAVGLIPVLIGAAFLISWKAESSK